MKHLLRVETLKGFAFLPKYPTRVTIRHVGSGQTWHMPLAWAADVTLHERLDESAAALIDRDAFRQILLNRLDNAVNKVLAEGPRTRDLGGTANTQQFTDAVIAALA